MCMYKSSTTWLSNIFDIELSIKIPQIILTIHVQSVKSVCAGSYLFTRSMHWPWFKQGMLAHSSMLTSQFWLWKPAMHSHVYVATWSRQVAPFWQGCTSHSSISTWQLIPAGYKAGMAAGQGLRLATYLITLAHTDTTQWHCSSIWRTATQTNAT